jgi:hypothetical protein
MTTRADLHVAECAEFSCSIMTLCTIYLTGPCLCHTQGIKPALCVCFLPVCRIEAECICCAHAHARRRKAFFLCCVPVYHSGEVTLEKTHADAHGREAFCVCFVPICRVSAIDSCRAHAGARRRKAFCLCFVPVHLLCICRRTPEKRRFPVPCVFMPRYRSPT